MKIISCNVTTQLAGTWDVFVVDDTATIQTHILFQQDYTVTTVA